MMTRKLFRSIPITALVVAACAATLHAQNASPSSPSPSASPSLQEQLEAQYPLATIDMSGGCRVSGPPESGLVVQKRGMSAFPATSFIEKCASHYKNGKLESPSSTCGGRTESALRFLRPDLADKLPKRGDVPLAPGETIYPTKLEVNVNRGDVKVSLGYCSGDSSPAPYKSLVIFQFPADILKTGNLVKVEDTISEVFKQQAADPPAQNQEGNSPAVEVNLASQPNEQTAKPSPVAPKVGQTLAEVLGALGEPDMKAEGKAGKLICVWKADKIKITFIDGKVVDIE